MSKKRDHKKIDQRFKDKSFWQVTQSNPKRFQTNIR